MTATATVRTLHDIPGWFPWADQCVFGHFLSPAAVAPRGDLVELGVYLGKSAVLIGQARAPEETFTVIDLFETPAEEASNRAENDHSYRTLTRQAFENNYRALHDDLPRIVQGPSSAILDHVRPHSARFVHVDASHLYEHVTVDIESARVMLLENGVVALDDFRSEHTPGVAAAVWEAVFTKGLHPVCVTPQKLYGTFDDPAPHRESLRNWLSGFGRLPNSVQRIAGQDVVRIWNAPKPKVPPPPDLTVVTGLLEQLNRRTGALEKQVGSVARHVQRNRPLSHRVVRRITGR